MWRLGRSLHDLILMARRLEEVGIGLVGLQEKIDTSSSGGRLIFHMFGALAEFERQVIRERTQAGLNAARAAAREVGPNSLIPPSGNWRSSSMKSGGIRLPRYAG